MFGYLGGGSQPYAVANPQGLFVFAFQVLPLILVISALSALLWHWGILKLIIRGFGLPGNLNRQRSPEPRTGSRERERCHPVHPGKRR